MVLVKIKKQIVRSIYRVRKLNFSSDILFATDTRNTALCLKFEIEFC